MGALIQLFVDNEPKGSAAEADHVPDIGEEIEVDRARYTVKNLVFTYFSQAGPQRPTANVYLQPVGDEPDIADTLG
jgi:hypothetical protein